MSLNVCAFRNGKAVASITLESRRGKIVGLIVRYAASLAMPHYANLDYLMANLPDGSAYQLDSDCFTVIPQDKRQDIVFSYELDGIADKHGEAEAAKQFVDELETLKHIAEIENLPLAIN